MARNARKKERHRHKRARRQRDLQRTRSGSPYRRIGNAGGEVACYINRRWRETGQATIQCLRRVPGGGHAMVAFLVDLWCVGLKDAWGRLDISANTFHERIRETPEEIDLVRVDLDVVKHLVAGAVRFSRENGFRLPKRYERWVALLGDVGDIDSADLTDFGVDDGLRYVGTVEDLAKRLINSEPQAFLARDDVHYILGAAGPDGMDAAEPVVDEAIVDEAFDTIKDHGLRAVRQWCFANAMAPHPRLPEAWDIMFEAIGQVEPAAADAEPTDAAYDTASDNIQRFLDLESPDAAADLAAALTQVRAFMQQFDSPDAFAERLGCGRLDSDR